MSELFYKGVKLVIQDPILLPIPMLFIATIIAAISDSYEYFQDHICRNKER